MSGLQDAGGAARCPATAPAASRWQQRCEQGARCMVVASAFAVPLPAAWIGLTTTAFLLLWLMSFRPARHWAVIRATPIAWTALLLWAWMAFALVWSPAGIDEAMGNCWQYRELLLLPLMASVVLCDRPTAQRWQPRIFSAFVLGFLIALATSFLRWVGVLPDMGFKGLYAGFGGRTGFSLMLAFVAFAAMERLRTRHSHRLHWGLLACACLVNLFWINTGRTGQLGFLLLLPLLAWRWAGLRGLVGGALAIPVLCLGLYATVPTIQERVHESIDQVSAFRTGKVDTGDALRLQYWGEALNFIQDAPAFGGGTGSHAWRARQAATQEARVPNRPLGNPHNEYLLILSQQGVVGLVLLCLLWGMQWRETLKGDDGDRPLSSTMTQGLLILVASGDLANSFLLDNLEGHFYILMTLAFARVTAHLAPGRLEEATPAHAKEAA